MKGRFAGYLLAGITVLLILVFLGRYALREAPPEPTAAKIEPVEPQRQHRPRPVFQVLPAEPPVTQPQESPVTNAATLYRQAFALYDALSKEEKVMLADSRTNVDASVEAELCEKIRPICDLMHEATVVTNCDWGIEPLAIETELQFLSFLSPSRACVGAAIWSANHCRKSDSTRATDDVLSALRLGKQVSQACIIGSLVDIGIQGIAAYGVASNLNSFRGVDGQRLAAAIGDAAYAEAPARAMEQDATMVDRFAARLATLPQAEFEKEIEKLTTALVGMRPPPKMDQAAAADALNQIADLQRELGKLLASGSEAEYEAWQRESDELQKSNPLAKLLLAALDGVVDKVQRAVITREMLIAALAVAETGTDALTTHPDPATGQPFIYTETADGFELQSGYQTTNGPPLKMQFK